MDGGFDKKFWEIILGVFILIFVLVILLVSVLKEEPILNQHKDIINNTTEIVEEDTLYEDEIEEEQSKISYEDLNNNISISNKYEDSIVEFENFSVEFKN